MSYKMYSLIPNLGVIYYMFWIIVALCVIGYLIDSVFKKSRNVEGGNLPLTKFGTNFLLRFFMAVYLEICITTMIQFQRMQFNGFQFFVSSVSAALFAVLSLGIIAWTIYLMIVAPSEKQAM
jgi:hypothetical protein